MAAGKVTRKKGPANKRTRAKVGGSGGGMWGGKEEPTPATPSLNYTFMAPKWRKINALLGGTDAMRAAGQTYLPQHEAEVDKRYSSRLEVNVLLNMTKLTLDTWTGKPFSDPIRLNDDVPEDIVALVENVDLLGNNLTVYARNWFRDGLAKAFSHTLVEMPRKNEPEGRKRTLEDDRRENNRPYLVHVEPESLIFAQAAIVDGQEILQEIRIHEVTVEQVGDFGQEVIERIRRIIVRGDVKQVTIYRKVEDKKKTDKVEWVVEFDFPYDLDEIPLVTFYANREGFMMGTSPLDDLADLNITHWQSGSDQRAVLTVARFPMLALSGGVDDANALQVGPHKWLFTPDKDGKFYYVEHTGAAIGAGRNDLQDLEEQMSHYGAQFVKHRPSHTSATSRLLDSIESTTPLHDATLRFKDAVEEVLRLMGKWMRKGNDDAGTIEINTEFDKGEYDDTDIKALLESRKNRDLSRPKFLAELRRRDLLTERFDADENTAELEEEAKEEVEKMIALAVDIDPQQGKPPGDKPPVKKKTEPAK